MDNATRTFDRLRSRLQSIAYRMLGSVAEAEEVVQDAWLRWHEARHDALESAEAWLVTVTTRLAIDRLRTAKVQRAHYAGAWLPEPQLTDGPATPEQVLERADQLSLAVLTALERLSPEARAAFLMREVFDADYGDVARTIGKTQAACRQLVHRAKAQVREARPRYVVPQETHRRLLGDFARALAGGDFTALQSFLADDAELIGDGGGKVPAFARLAGGRRIAQLYYAAGRRHRGALRYEPASINGEWGLLRFIDGHLESAQVYETDGERIVRIRVQRNPEKLVHLARTLGARAHRD